MKEQSLKEIAIKELHEKANPQLDLTTLKWVLELTERSGYTLGDIRQELHEEIELINSTKS